MSANAGRILGALLLPWVLGVCVAGFSPGVSAASAVSAALTAPAELVVRNGRFYTLDAGKPWAQAVAVRDGRFVAIGSDAEVVKLVGPATQVVDLHGAMVVPGLSDVHAHPLEGAYEALYNCAIPPAGDLDAVLAAVGACAERAQPDDWIVGGPWSSALLGALEKPASLAALDRASKGLPVLLRDDTFHNRWVNSVVLQRAGIGPGGAAPAGGAYVMADGKPTGLIKEPPAWQPIERRIPPRTPERLKRAAEAAAQTLNRFGITGVQDAFVTRQILFGWHAADTDGQGLPLRVVASMGVEPDAGGDGLPDRQALAQVRSDRLRPDFVKFFLDGVPMSYTAAMLEPYAPSDGHGHDFRGAPLYSLEVLTAKLTALDKQGTPVKLHAVGDGAVRLALDAIEAVRKANGMNGPRHQIAHLSFIAPADMPRFAALNVAADVSPMLWFPHAYTPLFEKVVGHARTMHSYPIGSLIKAGALVAGGSDWPAGQQTSDPWLGIEGLVTRRNPAGTVPGVLDAHEAIPLDQALRLYTLNSATAMGLGQEAGSIEVGKSADFAVLSQDLFKIPPSRIHRTTVRVTYFQGRPVYRAADQ
ncbi:amidohydrolase [Ralstonia solanacearum]|uniref:amidohydrolase n=1 Tax=Ralstonia solanacearum TaxID=305 RepID=UPI0035132F15